MARTVPTAYIATDPDRSFVAGSENIGVGTGTTATPHGGADLAANVRYLFAEAGAVHVVPQVWEDDLWFGRASAVRGGTPDLEWRFHPDEAFDEYEVTIYYEANAANAGGFVLRCPEAGTEIALETLNAGGADRRVSEIWTGSGIAALGTDYASLELYTLGDGANANAVKGVWVRRVAVLSPIPAGKFYGGAFVTPDSSQWAADAPLTPDKVDDLRFALAALYANRRTPKLVYAATTKFAEAHLAMLHPLAAESFARTHNAIGETDSTRDVTIYGGLGPDDLTNTSTEEYTANVPEEQPAYAPPNGAVVAPGNGYGRVFGQYVVAAEDFSALLHLAIEGP